MNQGQSQDDFNRARAELFEALGHPARIKILEAMKDSPMSFSELKKAAGIESSGHLTFVWLKINPNYDIMSKANSRFGLDRRHGFLFMNGFCATGGRRRLGVECGRLDWWIERSATFATGTSG